MFDEEGALTECHLLERRTRNDSSVCLDICRALSGNLLDALLSLTAGSCPFVGRDRDNPFAPIMLVPPEIEELDMTVRSGSASALTCDRVPRSVSSKLARTPVA